jgi:phosphate transport system protein
MRVRQHYDEELLALHHQLTDLGAMAAVAVERALNALAHQDAELARQIVADDKLADRAEQELHSRAVTIIATQQPVARDLRSILAAIAVANELERIADYAKGIAKLVVGPEGAQPLQAPSELLRLGASAHAMLGHTLSALATLDEGSARALFAEEEQIDKIYKPLKVALADALGGSPVGPARAADLLFIAHNLERIADRSTNIAERIIYYASGETVELNP